jgi:hypothetical protein
MTHVPEWGTIEALDPRDLRAARSLLEETLDWAEEHTRANFGMFWAWRLNLAYVNARIARLNPPAPPGGAP